jgi:protein TonB
LNGPFVADRKYHVKCAVDNGELRAWISDTPDGNALPNGIEELGVGGHSTANQAPATPIAPRETQPKSLASDTNPRMDPLHPLKIGGRYYPAESLHAKEQGRCVVSVTVAADGWLKDASIQQSTGYARLDQACLDAVAGGRLILATQSGISVEKTIALPIVWSLP